MLSSKFCLADLGMGRRLKEGELEEDEGGQGLEGRGEGIGGRMAV